MNFAKYISVIYGFLFFSQYGFTSSIQEDENTNQVLTINLENSTHHNSQYYTEEKKTFLEEVKNSISLLRRELYVEDKRIGELSPKSRVQVITSPQFSQMKIEFQALEEEWAKLLKGYSTFTSLENEE